MGSSNGGVPPGFRFHPTDEELLHYYLKKKISFQKFDMEVIREVDLNKMEPWELQERCRIGSTPQNEWYFFSHKDRKYPTGSRTNRATSAGFWKATGRDKCIRNTYKKIGMRKTLVFYRGRAPHGQKTDWIMHEYRLEDGDHDPQGNNEDGWVVCRVFKKKNLFKVGSDQGSSSMNSSDQQLNTNSSSTTHHHHHARGGGSSSYNNIMHAQYHNHHQHQLLRHHHHQQQVPFELNNKPDLGLHYAHIPPAPTPDHHHYSLFHSQALVAKPLTAAAYEYSAQLLPTDSSPLMAKQLMTISSNPTRDCADSTSESLQRYQACEPGLEVGTCDPAGRDHDDHDQGGMSEWAMLDRLVNTSQLGNHDQDSSKGAHGPFDDQDSNAAVAAAANSTSVHPAGPAGGPNQLSLRGEEMDLWGYGAK